MDINQWIQNIRDDGLEAKQLIGIAGTAVTFIGVFTPIRTFEMFGNISLVGSNIFAGILILVLSVVTLVLSLINKCRWFWATGAGIVLTAAAAMISILLENGYSFESMRWGWGVLFMGAILIFAAAVLEEISRHR